MENVQTRTEVIDGANQFTACHGAEDEGVGGEGQNQAGSVGRLDRLFKQSGIP